MFKPKIYKDEDIQDIFRELEEDEKWRDPLFGSDKDLCKTAINEYVSQGQEVEWIRAGKIPIFTDDDGQVQMFRTEYTDEEGEVQETDLKKEYHSFHLGNSMLAAAFEVAAPVLAEGLVNDMNLESKGCVTVLLKFRNHFAMINVDDTLPCVDMVPIYAKARSGALWCSFVEKALAKYLEGYENISQLNTLYNVGDILNILLPVPTYKSEFDTAFSAKEETPDLGCLLVANKGDHEGHHVIQKTITSSDLKVLKIRVPSTQGEEKKSELMSNFSFDKISEMCEDSESMKEQLGVEDGNQDYFYMTLDQVKEHFENIFVTQVDEKPEKFLQKYVYFEGEQNFLQFSLPRKETIQLTLTHDEWEKYGSLKVMMFTLKDEGHFTDENYYQSLQFDSCGFEQQGRSVSLTYPGDGGDATDNVDRILFVQFDPETTNRSFTLEFFDKSDSYFEITKAKLPSGQELDQLVGSSWFTKSLTQDKEPAELWQGSHSDEKVKAEFFCLMRQYGYSWFKITIEMPVKLKVTFEQKDHVFKGHKTTELVEDIDEELQPGEHYRLFVGNCKQAVYKLNVVMEWDDPNGNNYIQKTFSNIIGDEDFYETE